jgi:hypothetical protein
MRRHFVRNYIALVLILLTLFATSCRITHQIEAGQKVSIDPCSLVDPGKIEKVLGAPLAPAGLLLTPPPQGVGKNAYCHYEKKGAEGNGEYFQVYVGPETEAELSKRGQNIVGLGREAVVWEGNTYGTYLDVLSDEGAVLFIAIAISGRDEKALVDAVKPLAKEALAKIEDDFPGKHAFQSTSAPIDVCSLLSDDEATRLSQSSQDRVLEGYREEWVNGSWGGSWGCRYYPENAAITPLILKNPTAYEALMARGEPITGLGAKAYWKPPIREPSLTAGRLYVVGKNGKAFGVDVESYDPPDDQAHKDLAVEAAKLILQRI